MEPVTPGVEFAGFRIDRVAGRGGMGVVYRATELALDRTVALKVITEGALTDARARERFMRESRIAAAIEHPNVIPIHAVGEQDGVAYIVMRFVEGEDLAARLRRSGPLDVQTATTIVTQLAAALDAAHAKGLIHRDVKPANVLLAGSDHVYLTDFGVARRALSASAITGTGAWVGTLDYAAPEQIRGSECDHRVDVYALGCVLHQLLTGSVPFPRDGDEARLWAHLHALPPTPSALVGGLPRGFDQVIGRALAKDPDERWQTAGDLAAGAVAARDGRPLPAGTTATTRRRHFAVPVLRPGLRKRVVIGAAAAALATGAAVIALHGSGSNGRLDAGTKTAPAPRVSAQVKVLDRPRALAATDDAVWVAGDGGERLVRLRPPSLQSTPAPEVGPGARDLVLHQGELWVALRDGRRVLRLDAEDGSERRSPIVLPIAPAAIAAGEGAVWVAEQDPAGGPAVLARIDIETNRVSGTLTVPGGINDVRAGRGGVWIVVRNEPTLLKVKPDSLAIVASIPVGPHALRADVGEDSVWVTNHDDDSVSRVNIGTGEVVTIAVPRKPFGIAVRGRNVWIACFADSSLARIDVQTNRLAGAPVPVGINPVDVVAGDRNVWVAGRGDDTVTQVTYG